MPAGGWYPNGAAPGAEECQHILPDRSSGPRACPPREVWELNCDAKDFYFSKGKRQKVAESQPWSVAEWALAPRFDANPRAAVLVRLLV